MRHKTNKTKRAEGMEAMSFGQELSMPILHLKQAQYQSHVQYPITVTRLMIIRRQITIRQVNCTLIASGGIFLAIGHTTPYMHLMTNSDTTSTSS